MLSPHVAHDNAPEPLTCAHPSAVCLLAFPSAAPSNRFVGNLPFSVTEDDVAAMFEGLQVGHAVCVWVAVYVYVVLRFVVCGLWLWLYLLWCTVVVGLMHCATTANEGAVSV